MTRNIYLDHNATTPLADEAREAMAPFEKEWFGNPSSLHKAGVHAAREIRRARHEVASLLGARQDSEIVFTSGGTESNNAAFRSALFTSRGRRRIVTSAVEHSSILKLARALEEEGIEASYLAVDRDGHLEREKLLDTFTSDTALVSLMAANNETGVIFPVDELGAEVRSRGILFHVDAVQAVGKVPFNLKESPIDFLSLSAHKFGGPKGIGALYVRDGVPFRPLIFGGAQEKGRRAGTENVPGIIGLGAACRYLQKQMTEEADRVRRVRDAFENEILRKIPRTFVNGDPAQRVPNTTNLTFDGVDAEALLILLDEEGIYASSGSACLSGSREPSHVLRAMGLPKERARNSVRFSFGRGNTLDQAEETVGVLIQQVARLREIELEKQHPHPVP